MPEHEKTLQTAICQLETKYQDDYAVSVIIPVFNVRDYISRCADSLMRQTLADVEFIFVDDASPDDSIEILRSVLSRYPERHQNVRIISHDENRGLPAARNTGLKLASGKYIFHCDSDDYVEVSMLKDLYEYAEANEADIIWTDWYMSMADCERYMHMPGFRTCEEAIRAMLSGGMKYNVWNKFVRRSLYTDNGISFPAGFGMGEDLTMIKLFAFAQNVLHLPAAYYHYNKTNSAAFSQTYSDRHLIELRHNVDDMTRFVAEHLGTGYEQETAFLKLEAKFPFLLSPDRSRMKIWKNWYPEADRFIKRNKYISAKNRILQTWAKNNLWILVKIYNILFNNIVYGIIYR